MAKKSGATILQEELYAPPRADRASDSGYGEASCRESPRGELDDARLVDLDADQESPFLRAQKRVSARRSSLPKKTAHGLIWGSVAAVVVGVAALLAGALYSYGEHSWRFRLQSSDDIEITGMQNVTRAQVMEVMGADIGRNIFFIPLRQQKTQLEQIPWVESASVMRFVPNRLKVEIHERTPVAFARVGAHISLIDAGGTLMELPRNHKYSFPVILGMNPGEPLSTRAPRMKAYNELIRELDSEGARYSQDLSEVDLSDLDDIKVRVNDPAGDVLLELGSSDFLKRYKIYVAHVREWRQQFQKLESVNLRYDNQVIVNPEIEGKPKPPALTAAAAKAAVKAGVKPAALVTKLNTRAVPKPAFELSPQTLNPKAAKKPARPKLKTKVASASGRLSRGHLARASNKTRATHKAAPKQLVSYAKSAPARAVPKKPVSATIPKPSPAIVKQTSNGGQS
jgi:cell division protein FtsQ